MQIDTNTLIAMTEANQNFSKVVRVVDKEGTAVILKNNKPRYVVMDFSEYDALQELRALRQKMIERETDTLIDENIEALRSLASDPTQAP